MNRRRLEKTVVAAVAAAAVLLAAAGVAAALGAFSTARRSSPAISSRMDSDRVEIASVYRGGLSITDVVTGKSVIVASGPYHGVLGSAVQDPAFSHDGGFVAYVENLGSSSVVHVVPAGGGKTISIDGGLSFAWSPVHDDLAVAFADRVELISADGTVLRRWVMAIPFEEVFSPSGRTLAVSSSGLRSGRGYLRLLPVGGGQQRFIRQSGCDEVAGWTAGGSDVLFWRDLECSASIGADGLPLDSIPINRFRTPTREHSSIVTLASTLPYRRWAVPLARGTVLVNSGDDRVAADDKRLQLCRLATGACKSLPVPAGTTTLDPAAAQHASLLFEVRVRQSTAADDYLPHGTLWMSTTSGRDARELKAAGTGVADPVPTANGTVVFFVRMISASSAKIEALTLSGGTVKKLAAVDLADYYGEFQAPQVLAIWQPRS